MADRFLPYGRHVVDEDDVAAVVEVLRGDWLTMGPEVRALEADFASAVGARHALACNSGTAALHMAAHALGLGPGDHVIVPAMTFLATANAALYVGADVVFADVDPETGNMTAETLLAAAKRANGPVRAVFPVHLKGLVADPTAIADTARSIGAEVVEDACHALGTSYAANGKAVRVGACAHSRIATFSLHPVKTIAMGEGGIVTTNDPVLAEGMRRFRSHGMVHDPAAWEVAEQGFTDGVEEPWYYEMPSPGFNYRAPDVSCALARSQLRKLDRFVASRAALASAYDRLLQPLAPHVLPPKRVDGCAPGWHLYAVRIDFAGIGMKRGEVMRALRSRGIGTQVHYIPVPWQPYWRKRQSVPDLPGTDRYYARTLSLPLFPTMVEGDVVRVVSALADVLGLDC